MSHPEELAERISRASLVLPRHYVPRPHSVRSGRSSRSPSRTPTGARTPISRYRTPQQLGVFYKQEADREARVRRRRGHRLSKSSARRGTALNDTYIGLSFRMIEKGDPRLGDYLKLREGRLTPFSGSSTPLHESVAQMRLAGDTLQLKDGQALLTWGAIISDGVGTIDSGQDAMIVELGMGQAEGKDGWKEVKRVAERICLDAMEVAAGKSMVFQVIAVSEPLPPLLKNSPIFLSTLWFHLNTIPFLLPSPTMMFGELPDPPPEYLASHAVSKAIKHLHPAIHSAVTVPLDEKTHRVQVDCDGMIQTASLDAYKQSTSPQLWRRFMALVRHVKGNKIKFVRCSATPQGGGVALMQHALVRLFRLLGLHDTSIWLVPEPHVSVFDITKKKFHNVLQGVASPDVHLEDIDKKYFEIWTRANYEAFWRDTGVLEDRIVVIDDPQLTALIPLIKQRNPQAQIVFRSHIQIQSDLIDDPRTEQYKVWEYHFQFVKQADVFLSHPVEFFVPRNVKEYLPVLYMAPSTDPLDGLNKPLGKTAVDQLREQFNHLSQAQCRVSVDWKRGYVLQVARFDPSKGLSDLLAAYLRFRNKLRHHTNIHEVNHVHPPMLVVVGHGSVDDPDGTIQYEMVHEMLASDDYQLIRDDVSIVRAPPSDTLLGMLMQGAWCAAQLSIREGFEVKVSEAILKRIPIVASKAGGIPLQIKDGMNGWLVDPSDPEAVAEILYEIYIGKRKLNRKAEMMELRHGLGHKSSTLADGPKGLEGEGSLATTCPTPSESRLCTARADFALRPEEQGDRKDDGSDLKELAMKPEPVDIRLAESEGRMPEQETEAVQDWKESRASVYQNSATDLNVSADEFVKKVGADFPCVKADRGSPSEAFFTVGNAARWLLLFSLMSGKPIKREHHQCELAAGEEIYVESDIRLLESMGLSEQGHEGGRACLEKYRFRNLWDMVMGQDVDDGGRVLSLKEAPGGIML